MKALYQININAVTTGTFFTPDGPVDYHRDGDKVVYDSNGEEISLHHYWEIEAQQKAFGRMLYA
jgi:hypothetical protein